MKTTTFADIVFGVEDLLGVKRGTVDNYDWNRIKTWCDSRLRAAWEFAFWPDLVVTEKRFCRPVCDPTANDGSVGPYAEGEERFYHTTGKYYVCMVANTDRNPLDANGALRATKWVEAQRTFSGTTAYSATATYAAGALAK